MISREKNQSLTRKNSMIRREKISALTLTGRRDAIANLVASVTFVLMLAAGDNIQQHPAQNSPLVLGAISLHNSNGIMMAQSPTENPGHSLLCSDYISPPLRNTQDYDLYDCANNVSISNSGNYVPAHSEDRVSQHSSSYYDDIEPDGRHNGHVFPEPSHSNSKISKKLLARHKLKKKDFFYLKEVTVA